VPNGSQVLRFDDGTLPTANAPLNVEKLVWFTNLFNKPARLPEGGCGARRLRQGDESAGSPVYSIDPSAQSADHSAERLRVLVLAYACCPDRGSEPGIGWNRVLHIAKHCDTWVLCEQHEFEAKIREYLRLNGPVPGLAFLFVPMHPWERALQRFFGLYYLFYHRWHQRAFRAARRAHAQVGFDIVHQLTMGGYREPGYLWKIDTPFVWGPTGGTENYPWRFLGEAGCARAFEEAARSILNYLQLRFSPRVARAQRKAAILLTANSTNRDNFLKAHGRDSIVFCDAGLQRLSGAPRKRRAADRALRILSMGRLETRKALSLLIKALARVPSHVACELRVVGCGPAQRRWQRLADKTGAAGRITWAGWLPYREAVEQYAWADVFAFSSLRDTTGTAVLEALGAALPVLCLDHNGAADIVTDECGIKVPVTTPEETIRGLCEAITRLAADRDLCERLSRGALCRAKDYYWETQGDRVCAIYRRALEQQWSCTADKEGPRAAAAGRDWEAGQTVAEDGRGVRPSSWEMDP